MLDEEEVEQEAYEIEIIEKLKRQFSGTHMGLTEDDAIINLNNKYKQQLFYTNHDDYFNDLHIEVL